MSVFQDYALTISVILILFVIGCILHSLEGKLGHSNALVPRADRLHPAVEVVEYVFTKGPHA